MPKLRRKQGIPYLSLAMSGIGSCNFFSFKAKKSRYILGLCSVYEKSHPPGFQVREKRKIKTEPGSELWSSQR